MKRLGLGVLVGIILAVAATRLLAGPPQVIKYTEFQVDTIYTEPDTVVQWRERIVYREAEPNFVATQPGGAADRVEAFCHPDTVVQVVQGDTVFVPAPNLFVVSAVDTDPSLLFGRDHISIYGFDNAGNRREYDYTSWPGWQFAAGQDILFQEPRFGWVRSGLRIAVPLVTGWFLNDLIR